MTTTNVREALLPCPFCGGEPSTDTSYEVGVYYGCHDCSVWQRGISAWNQRASQGTPAPQSAEPMAQAQAGVPDGYAYRYPGPYGGLRFNQGQDVNGSRPVEAVPYWLGKPPSPEPREPSQPTPEQGEAVAPKVREKDIDRWQSLIQTKPAGPWEMGCGGSFDRTTINPISDDMLAELSQWLRMGYTPWNGRSMPLSPGDRQFMYMLYFSVQGLIARVRVAEKAAALAAPQPAPEKAEAIGFETWWAAESKHRTCDEHDKAWARLGWNSCLLVGPTHPEQKAEAAVPAGLVSDLSLLVMRMARRLSITDVGSVHVVGNKNLAQQATDYLRRKGLTSPLREDASPTGTTPTEGQA